MPKFEVNVFYNEVIVAEDQFEAEQLALAEIENELYAWEVEEDEED